jgi:hypothetical protein
MAKASVYLRDELLEEARRLEVPVSSVCQRAVEEAVRLSRAATEARSDLVPVAERLRRSETTDYDRRFQDGFDLGIRWAREHASLDELKDLAEMVRAGAPAILVTEDHSLPAFLTGCFWDADVPPDLFTRLGERPFDRGIVAGATEVYEAVRPLLEPISRRRSG